MIYQLPTGAIVHISLEQYLDLTHDDIQYLISIGNNPSPNNPFHSSELSKKGVVGNTTPHDTSIDYDTDDDEIKGQEPIDLDQLPDE